MTKDDSAFGMELDASGPDFDVAQHVLDLNKRSEAVDAAFEDVMGQPLFSGSSRRLTKADVEQLFGESPAEPLLEMRKLERLDDDFINIIDRLATSPIDRKIAVQKRHTDIAKIVDQHLRPLFARVEMLDVEQDQRWMDGLLAEVTRSCGAFVEDCITNGAVI